MILDFHPFRDHGKDGLLNQWQLQDLRVLDQLDWQVIRPLLYPWGWSYFVLSGVILQLSTWMELVFASWIKDLQDKILRVKVGFFTFHLEEGVGLGIELKDPWFCLLTGHIFTKCDEVTRQLEDSRVIMKVQCYFRLAMLELGVEWLKCLLFKVVAQALKQVVLVKEEVLDFTKVEHSKDRLSLVQMTFIRAFSIHFHLHQSR